MFKNPFSFNGRIRRLEYGLSYILCSVLQVGVEEITNLDEAYDIFGLLLIPVFWFIFAQGAKRCHDRGNSGWYQIIPFYIFWMIFAESEDGENEYGLNPKGIGNRSEIDDIGKPEFE